MGNASRYWNLVKIDAGGKQKILEIPAAKSFFTQMFAPLVPGDDVPDGDIQFQLLQLYNNALNETALLAERCLLCFLSWVLEQGCLQLVRKFGEKHNFRCSDLLPFVLDDDGKLSPASKYKCFSRQILQSFDSQQSSLTTWAMIRVKQHPELNKFLLECGVYLISDWAILNDTQPKQLERILKEFHTLSVSHVEIEEAQYLLQSYHTIYRVQRLQQIRKKVRSICTEPTTEQLENIAQYIKNKTGRLFDAETVRRKLKKLATQLREYRIYVRGGSLPIDSLDAVNQGKFNSLLEETPAPSTIDVVESNDEQAEFLQFYRQQVQISLQQALAKVTESKVRQLQRKKGDKAHIFLTALELSQCQKLAMKEIAEKLGMRAQDAVTKLLKLKELRTDVQQEMLMALKDAVKEKAKLYAEREVLKQLDEQLTIVLSSEISKIIENAEIQSRTMKSYLKPDIFAERLCEYLDIRKQENNQL
ncbi:hypothetical protein F7734_13740 [Scytonema sp. UIC 10036]|uniref:hypothetical protein n=1 Tax=Scytonema sp. UIC 10036 TaxID=2304196 RepID=UPI0012DA4745|nr:hypothetical protein [Scytonema sp. UIC 10036]MUG93434.1 hypothetical protein [Scytonema sp. UIC 10036]